MSKRKSSNFFSKMLKSLTFKKKRTGKSRRSRNGRTRRNKRGG